MSERAVLDIGPFKVEIRRDADGYMDFRPIPDPDSMSLAGRTMNLEFGLQGGAWAPVPDDLKAEAEMAFAPPQQGENGDGGENG